MNDSEFSYFWAALHWKFGIMIGLAAWQTAIRIPMVFINSKIKEFLEGALPEDKLWLTNILNHRAYRIFVFILNAILSIKLPTNIRAKGDSKLLTREQVDLPPTQKP